MRLPAFLARLHTRKDLAALRSQDQTASIVAALLDLEGPLRAQAPTPRGDHGWCV
jgi:hypothetical protein